jgi:hypothetical protein
VGHLHALERLISGLDLPGLGYRVEEFVTGERAMHVTLRRRD